MSKTDFMNVIHFRKKNTEIPPQNANRDMSDCSMSSIHDLLFSSSNISAGICVDSFVILISVCLLSERE